MISNERQWPSQDSNLRQLYYQRPDSQQIRPSVPEDSLAARELQIESKHFRLMLKENLRGRFARIAEDSNGRTNSIMIPSTGLLDFLKLVEEMVKVSGEIPGKDNPPAP